MNNKKLGYILLILSIIIGIILLSFMGKIQEKGNELGCFDNPGCKPLEASLSTSHFAIGVLAFILSLSIYLIIFAKESEILVQRLEKHSKEEVEKERFRLICMGLDDAEKKVIKAVKEQEGITQNTMMLRVNMSKAKLSQVLQNLEKNKLIYRKKKNKTYEVFLRFKT